MLSGILDAIFYFSQLFDHHAAQIPETEISLRVTSEIIMHSNIKDSVIDDFFVVNRRLLKTIFTEGLTCNCDKNIETAAILNKVLFES